MKGYQKIILTIAVVALVGLAVLLVADRLIPKSFSDLCPAADKLESCRILYAADGTQSEALTGGDLADLTAKLESVSYIKEGTYDSVMEGRVYILFFAAQGKEVFRMEISDAGKVYIGKWCYAIEPAVLSGYLEMVLQ